MKQIILMLCILPASAAELPAQSALPPPSITGAVTSMTAAELCHGFRTSSIRPDVDYTESLKKTQIGLLHYSDTRPSHYEEDHLVSLEIGGHPTDPRNLWPQPLSGKCGARVKDKLENELKKLVCAGKIALAQAQAEIAHDWVRSYNLHIGRLICD